MPPPVGSPLRPPLSRRFRVGVGLLVSVGLALRLLRLEWQPLWWDEGYSIFFASEPLVEMLRLTAFDIHPPFYYALLNGWFTLFGDTGAGTARLLSVGWGGFTVALMSWTARQLLPGRPRTWLLATLLFALSPMHLYYSQEVRMYAVALPLTMLATIAFARLLRHVEEGTAPWQAWLAYVLAVAASLATLYYTSLIFLTHQVWALIALRRRPARLRLPITAGIAGVLTQIPWLIYALPKLLPYIADKVQSDQDSPLPLWTYLWQHLLAFSAGHLPAMSQPVEWLRWFAPLLALGIIASIWIGRRHDAQPVRAHVGPPLLLLALPLLLGFLINLRYPFFPAGGERLFLTLLPYFLILVACGLDGLRRPGYAAAALALLLVPSILGIFIFFTVPRTVEHDYRPIVRYIAEHGRNQDTVIALFPWQVGYWRAYSPRLSDGTRLAPQPAPVDQEAITWTPALQARLDDALQQGTLWFPAPLSFGSTLPNEIEKYLRQVARPLDNRWFSAATRVSSWVALPSPASSWMAAPTELNADYGSLTLLAGRLHHAPSRAVYADNAPVAVDLFWSGVTPAPDLRASLRLVDDHGHVWAQRDLTPVAADTKATDGGAIEEVALAIPIGVVPGEYSMRIALAPVDDERFLQPRNAPPDASVWLTLGTLRVAAPPQTPAIARLPLANHLDGPPAVDGMRLLGAEPLPPVAALAGDEINLSLFWQSAGPAAAFPSITLGLTNQRGDSTELVHRPLPLANRTGAPWPADILLRQPGTAYLPPDLPTGDYRLTARLVGRQGVAELGLLNVIQRPTSFTAVTPENPLEPRVQFGTHVQLVGYEVHRQGTSLDISLTWHVLQTLLPPHAIFVHVVDSDGQRVAQQDGPPTTATGRAPTGSWLAGEWLVTQHRLDLATPPTQPVSLQVGLYLPATLVRLPASALGSPIGDTATIPLP